MSEAGAVDSEKFDEFDCVNGCQAPPLMHGVME